MRHDISIRDRVRSRLVAASDAYGVAQSQGVAAAREHEKEFNEKWGISVEVDEYFSSSEVYEITGVLYDAETSSEASFRTRYITGYCFAYDPETGEYESIDDSCYSSYEVLYIDEKEGAEQHLAFKKYLEDNQPK